MTLLQLNTLKGMLWVILTVVVLFYSESKKTAMAARLSATHG